MRITISSPTLNCSRCDETTALRPTQLRCVGAPTSTSGRFVAVDDEGNAWLVVACEQARGWTEPATGKYLCPRCTAALAHTVEAFVAERVAAPPPVEPALPVEPPPKHKVSPIPSGMTTRAVVSSLPTLPLKDSRVRPNVVDCAKAPVVSEQPAPAPRTAIAPIPSPAKR